MEFSSRSFRPSFALALVGFTVLFGLALVGARSLQNGDHVPVERVQSTAALVVNQPGGQVAAESGSPVIFATRTPGGPRLTPTPDALHSLPALRDRVDQYTVQYGDSLAQIALRYQVNVDQLAQANNIADPNLLEVGQTLTIPLPAPENTGPDFKIIPDSELVYSPSSIGFDTTAFVQGYDGFLANYREEIDGREYNGAQIVERIAHDYSVNPRLLLAVLEYQSGWLTSPRPKETTLDYPMRLVDTRWKGLYRQLAWAANQLNRGYYLWRVNGAGVWLLGDGNVIPVSPKINAGTAGVQNMFALIGDRAGWIEAVTDGGVFETYAALFGYPFDYTYQPLIPGDLGQPSMQLPFEAGIAWSYTGGPHGGWGDGSAWAALDFAPPGDALGCIPSDEWVTAAVEGLVTRTGDGVVIQDLDGDGFEQTGWVLLYMHVEARDRVAPGTYLIPGDRIGHPSCEGGISNGTHVHIARKYNGEWIAADQSLPFDLGGWVSRGAGQEYDGYLDRDGQTIEAYEGRDAINQIQR